MGYLETIKSQVNGMLGMKYGSYHASINNMEKAYSRTENTNKGKMYYDNNKKVAETFFNQTDKEVAYAIVDKNTGRAYCTGWQDKDSATDKFTRIDFYCKGEAYSVIDTNGNGQVDKNDTVVYGGDPKAKKSTIPNSIKIGDLLRDNV